MPNLQDFLSYARLDVMDASAELCYRAAIAHVKNVGVPLINDNPKYDLYIYMMGLYYYDNRGFMPMAGNANDPQISAIMAAMRNELMYNGQSESALEGDEL